MFPPASFTVTDVRFLGADTRFRVALDAGGELIATQQNHTTTSMDALGVEKATLVGHDWGALAAHAAAALAEERLDGLVTLAIPHPAGLV